MWSYFIPYRVYEFPEAETIDYKQGAYNMSLSSSSPGDQMSEVKVSQDRGGSFPPLPASGGSRRPWACGLLPPVSVFTGLLLCVSPLLCLRRTLSLDVGPPSSRRTSSQTLHFLIPAETFCPKKILF